MTPLILALALSIAPAVVLDCPPGTVPGWEDQNGNPTSCVGDVPNPGGEDANGYVPDVPEETIAPVDEDEEQAQTGEDATEQGDDATDGDPGDHLAETGGDPGVLTGVAAAGILMAAVGAVAALLARSKMARR